MILKVPTYFEVETTLTPEELAQFREHMEDGLANFLIKSYGAKGISDTFLSKKVTVKPMHYKDVKKKITSPTPDVIQKLTSLPNWKK